MFDDVAFPGKSRDPDRPNYSQTYICRRYSTPKVHFQSRTTHETDDVSNIKQNHVIVIIKDLHILRNQDRFRNALKQQYLLIKNFFSCVNIRAGMVGEMYDKQTY